MGRLFEGGGKRRGWMSLDIRDFERRKSWAISYDATEFLGRFNGSGGSGVSFCADGNYAETLISDQ